MIVLPKTNICRSLDQNHSVRGGPFLEAGLAWHKSRSHRQACVPGWHPETWDIGHIRPTSWDALNKGPNLADSVSLSVNLALPKKKVAVGAMRSGCPAL